MTAKVKGILFSVILIVIALLMIPLVISSVHGVMTDSRTQAFPGCVVAATTTDVVLTAGFGLYRGDNHEVTGLTASGAGAVPAAGTYVAGTRTLTVTGLGAVTPQDLTVTYNYEANQAYNGVNAIVGLIPLLVVVGLMLVAVINGMWAIKQ
jgi:hypothetical protein